MSIFHLLMLAIVQGITEFLPISSSGHLILLPTLLGVEDQGTVLDVAVHVGTLGAVMLYFRRDVMQAIRGVPSLLRGDISGPEARLAFLLIVATIPVVLAGLVLKLSGLVDLLRAPVVVGWATLIFGVVLYWADKVGEEAKTSQEWTIGDAVKMGLWQVLALIPGASRSGVTITASRLLGYSRTEGARLAMLMSIPTIIASGVLLAGDVVADANVALAKDAGIAALMAFGAALIALALMMRLLQSVSFTPYVIYRLVLGVAILWFVG